MKRQFFGFLLAVWALSGFAMAQDQKDLVGEWTGYITQEPAGLAARYFFDLSLDMNMTRVEGEARISMEDSTQIFGVMAVLGTFEAGKIKLGEEYIKRQHLWSYAYWCIKHYELEMKWMNGILILEGNWTSDRCAGSTGIIHLERRLS